MNLTACTFYITKVGRGSEEGENENVGGKIKRQIILYLQACTHTDTDDGNVGRCCTEHQVLEIPFNTYLQLSV